MQNSIATRFLANVLGNMQGWRLDLTKDMRMSASTSRNHASHNLPAKVEYSFDLVIRRLDIVDDYDDR